MIRPPSWLYPPIDYASFFLSTPPTIAVVGTDVRLSTFTTQNRKLRIATLSLTGARQHQSNRLRFTGQGFESFRDFYWQTGDRLNANQIALHELPVWIIVPHLTEVLIDFNSGSGAQEVICRLTGWYF